jgi:hypothetical protein
LHENGTEGLKFCGQRTKQQRSRRSKELKRKSRLIFYSTQRKKQNIRIWNQIKLPIRLPWPHPLAFWPVVWVSDLHSTWFNLKFNISYIKDFRHKDTTFDTGKNTHRTSVKSLSATGICQDRISLLSKAILNQECLRFTQPLSANYHHISHSKSAQEVMLDM